MFNSLNTKNVLQHVHGRGYLYSLYTEHKSTPMQEQDYQTQHSIYLEYDLRATSEIQKHTHPLYYSYNFVDNNQTHENYKSYIEHTYKQILDHNKEINKQSFQHQMNIFQNLRTPSGLMANIARDDNIVNFAGLKFDQIRQKTIQSQLQTKQILPQMLVDHTLNLDQADLISRVVINEKLKLDTKQLLNPYKLYIVKSPTGTGKTVAYLSAMLFWMNAYCLKNIGRLRKTHTIIYANSDTVCTQIYEQITNIIPHLYVGYFHTSVDTSTNELRSSIRVGIGGQGVVDTLCEYGKQTELPTQPDIIVTPFHFSKLLYSSNILNPKTSNIQTVIYDEVDVYYNDFNLDQFHSLFMDNHENQTAQNIVFASATVDETTMFYRDLNMSSMLKAQLYNIVDVTIRQKQSSVSSILDGIIQNQEDMDLPPNKKLYVYDISTGTIKYSHCHEEGVLMPNYAIISDQLLHFTKAANLACVNREIQVVNNISNYVPMIFLDSTTVDLSIVGWMSKIASQQSSLLLYTDNRYIKKHMVSLSDSTIKAGTHLPTRPTSTVVGYEQAINAMKNHSGDHWPFSNDIIKSLTGGGLTILQHVKNKNIHLYLGDISQVGRGIDLPGLKQVFLFLPAHVSFKTLQFSYSDFKQTVGRVGRAGAVGKVYVVFYGVAKSQQDLDLAPDDDLKNLWSMGNNNSYDFSDKFTQFQRVHMQNAQQIKSWAGSYGIFGPGHNSKLPQLLGEWTCMFDASSD